MAVSFTEFSFDGQQRTSSLGFAWDAPFPLALQATTSDSSQLADAIAAVRSLADSGRLRDLVRQHGGAVLLRGLPIVTPQDYSEVAHALGFRAHEEVGRPPMRTVLAKNIKTANEGPPEMPIWPHNEYGWSTIHPAWLTFSALTIPAAGGETPVISSIGLASAIRQKAPRFYEQLLRRGVRYVYRYGAANEPRSNTGTSVFGAYGQNVLPEDDEATARRKIEAEVRRHSHRFVWNEDGSLTVTHTVPKTGLATWFGNVTSAWGRSVHHGATQPPYRGDDGSYHPPPTYGDGEPMEKEYLDLALALAESMQVLVHWQQGDIVLLDNIAVMHSRSPWKGQRQVLAALWDDDGRVEDYDEGKEILRASPRVPIVA